MALQHPRGRDRPKDLRRLLADPSLTRELLDEEETPLELDLDKATTDGAGEAVLGGGDPIGDEVGYGPARLLKPERSVSWPPIWWT